MILLLLVAVAGISTVIGLAELWRRRGTRVLATSVLGLVLLGICGFTAEVWFDWFGFPRGDGQIFIGYYLIGLGALGAAVAAVFSALAVLAVRPRNVGEQA